MLGVSVGESGLAVIVLRNIFWWAFFLAVKHLAKGRENQTVKISKPDPDLFRRYTSLSAESFRIKKRWTRERISTEKGTDLFSSFFFLLAPCA